MHRPCLRVSATATNGSSSASCRRPMAPWPSRGGRCSSCGACCPRCSRSRWACSSARCSAATAWPVRSVRRRRLRPPPGAHADPSGDQRQSRRSHGGLAVRPPDRGVRAPAGYGSPRGPEADERPHGRARLRPRHDRAAALDLDGLHRQRSRRDDRRRARARACSPPTRGGRRSSWPARGWRRTGCCARARSGAIATPTKCAVRSATPTTRIGSPSIRRPPRSCAYSASSSWTIDRFVDPPHPPARAAVRSDPAAREADDVESAARDRRQRARVLVARERRR